MEKRVIILAGPTASGKTDLAVSLAEKLGTEIISADSRQVYMLTDIGTAKPTAEQLNTIKHHLISVIPPDQTYNASLFEKDAEKIIDELHRHDKIPVVCGGTGLYLKALTGGISEGTDYDPAYREELMMLRAENGNQYIYTMLEQKDPVSAGRMLPQNWKRVIRALEVLEFTGKPIWEHHNQSENKHDYRFFYFILNPEREKLYSRINLRVDEMIKNGLADEVKSLLNLGYHYSKNNCLNTVGYKEIIECIEGKHDFESAVDLIKRNSRRYAKRQMTWFRSVKDAVFIDSENKQERLEMIINVISD